MLRAMLVSALLALAACTNAPEAIRLDAPEPNARITSPLQASGVADNSWYFEAVFPARLVSEDGELIAEAPAVASSDWTRSGDVPFTVEMAFTVDAETPALLVLQEDMPGDNRETRQMQIPVVLLP